MAVFGLLLVAACGGGDDDDGATGETASTERSEATSEPSGDLGHGVSADTIKVAVSLVDFKCIENFVDDVRLDQDKIYRAFFDDINESGGINGRKIEPVFKTYCPIPGAQPSSLGICTSAAQDDDVFAIMGVFVDFTGDAQLCVTRDQKRVLITHGLSQSYIDDAPPGSMVSPDITPERRLKVTLDLLASEKKLQGKTVAVLASEDQKGRIEDAVDPVLEHANVDRGSDGVLSITGTDTTAAQSQLDSFIEKWKSEHVDTLIIIGETPSAKQFVEKIKAEMPDLQLVADSATVLGQAQDLVRAGQKADNPYTGIIIAEGETGEQHSKGEQAARCRAIYKKHLGTDVPGPNEVVEAPNGKRNDIYGTVSDVCAETTMFLDIATKAGPTLNDATWSKAVEEMGPMRVASTKYASLGPGKYDADDTFGLVAFDPNVPADGDWKPLTSVQNVAELK
jgi:ABC-type branched-subunit amino acid transport system substrate-binding protein